MGEGYGLGLSRRFFEAVVAPVLACRFPHLRYAAARIGPGSDVLGYDTELSRDHDFGPCVQLFLPEDGFSEAAGQVMQALDAGLPERFEGFAVRYSHNIRPPAGARAGMLGADHGVELYTLAAWCERFLQRRLADDLTVRDWLGCPEQVFLIATAGAVFRDDSGELSDLRHRLAFFPADVWLYKLATQWSLIAEERALIGRAGSAGDETGSRIIAARMAENIMRAALLIERRYAPYPKWLGTCFARLPCAAELAPILDRVLSAGDWQQREAALIDTCTLLAELQIVREVPGAIAPTLGDLHGRPFRFIDSLKVANALREAITDPDVRRLPHLGAADQMLRSSAVLAVPRLAQAAWTGVMAERLWWE